jgi:hypothetical protein
VKTNEYLYDPDRWWAEPHHQDFVNDVLHNAPESWDGDESAESLAIAYVRALERRLDAANVSRERYVEPDPVNTSQRVNT